MPPWTNLKQVNWQSVKYCFFQIHKILRNHVKESVFRTLSEMTLGWFRDQAVNALWVCYKKNPYYYCHFRQSSIVLGLRVHVLMWPDKVGGQSCVNRSVCGVRNVHGRCRWQSSFRNHRIYSIRSMCRMKEFETSRMWKMWERCWAEMYKVEEWWRTLVTIEERSQIPGPGKFSVDIS